MREEETGFASSLTLLVALEAVLVRLRPISHTPRRTWASLASAGYRDPSTMSRSTLAGT